MRCVWSLLTRNKVRHFEKLINHNKNEIHSLLCARKSQHVKSFQLFLGTSNGVYEPIFWACSLATWRTRQLLTIVVTFFPNCGLYLSSMLAIVLSPKCPPSLLPCKSQIILPQRSPWHTKPISFKKKIFHNMIVLRGLIRRTLLPNLSKFFILSYSSFKKLKPMISLCKVTNYDSRLAPNISRLRQCRATCTY